MNRFQVKADTGIKKKIIINTRMGPTFFLLQLLHTPIQNPGSGGSWFRGLGAGGDVGGLHEETSWENGMWAEPFSALVSSAAQLSLERCYWHTD